jgi:hypothetical protein
MLAMTPTTKLACATALGSVRAPERCTERQRRLVQVKFMALPLPEAPEPTPSRSTGLLSRILGFLSVARR